jgi:hypothetical protein
VQRATVTIRHRVDVETTWRVLKDGAPWQIFRSISFKAASAGGAEGARKATV